MNTDFFPFFLQPAIIQCKKDISQAEKIQAIVEIFSKTISWLGKLVMLEYVQDYQKTKRIYWDIFSLSWPETPREWINIIHKILQHSLNFSSIASSLLKSPEAGNAQERILSLCSFYEMVSCGSYLVCSSDLLEANENIWDFLIDLEFLQNVTYQWGDKSSLMLLGNKVVKLEPFFCLREREGNLCLEEKEDVNFKKLYELYLPQEWEKYSKEQQGTLYFEDIEKTRNYIFTPWLESFLQKKIEDTLQWENGFPFGNVFFIEGHPATGKTALAYHLEHFLSTKSVDFCSGYFLQKSIILKSDSIISFFHKKLEKISVPLDRILFFVDGLELLSEREYYQLLEKVKEYPFSHILFFFFLRCYTHPVEDTKKIVLSSDGNPFFEESFTEEYIQGLIQKYLSSPLSKEIFHFMAERPKDFFTVKEIANSLSLFSPIVLKQIQYMKPLLSCVPLSQGKEKYCIFHPVCQKFLVALSR